jgi:hypothetical protein
MASFVVVSWKGIPTVVEAQQGAETAIVSLTERFQALVDAVAMMQGLADSEAYLDAWERSAPAERAGSAAEVAKAVAQEFEDRFFEYAQGAFVTKA